MKNDWYRVTEELWGPLALPLRAENLGAGIWAQVFSGKRGEEVPRSRFLWVSG